MGFIFRSQMGTTPAPPRRAHPPSGVEHLDAEALVALALGLGLQDAHRTYLGGRAAVGDAVGLRVTPHHVNGADRSEEVRGGKGCGSRCKKRWGATHKKK